MVLVVVTVGLAAIGCASTQTVASSDAFGRATGTGQTTDASSELPQASVESIAAQAAATDTSAEADQVAKESSDQPPAIRVTKAWVAEREIEELDPWIGFNEPVFSFNRQVDRFVLKPVATAYDWAIPDTVKQSVKNAFENLGMPRRVVNNALQGKLKESGKELARFLINTTVGIAGFFDVAKNALALEKSDEDTGQTLGVWGVRPGPYLILPLLPPLTVRDGVGWAADLAMDPLNYVLPFFALFGMTAEKTVNERSLNLEFYENVEETVLDLYTAVRNGYLQRRQKAIEE
jgi:phospholipid-binding lipoprotein MlaA